MRAVETPLRLNIGHYETIVAIVECGTMTEAARRLAITQSGMSHRLSEAERRLGVTLFGRGSDRRLTPTTHGVAVYQAAGRALGELSRLEEALVGRSADIVATIRTGVGSYETFDWYPGFLALLAERNPHVEVDLIAVGDDPAAALAARTIDVAIAPGRPEGDHELVPAFDDELVFVCAPDHRLAPGDVVEPHELLEETYLTYNPLPSPGFEYDRFIRPAIDAPRIVRVVRQTSAIVEMVAAGVGVSILSRWATRQPVEQGRLVTLRCGVDGLPITWHTLHRVGDEAAASVASMLGAHLRSMS